MKTCEVSNNGKLLAFHASVALSLIKSQPLSPFSEIQNANLKINHKNYQNPAF
jgi:hypothetical protein